MSSTGQEGQSPARRGRRRAARVVLGSAMLGATVFTVAALTGLLLSGAAPAGLISEPTPAESAATGTITSSGPGTATGHDAVDATFARSMVCSGAAALAVSVAGTAMVVRRRRHW